MNPETGEAAQRTCGGCRFFNLDTCMNVSNKRDGIRPEVDADASCHHFKEKMEGATWQVVNGDWRYGKWRPEEKREINPRLRTCGNCKSRKGGFCIGRVFSPAVIKDGKVVKPPGFIDIRESVDRDESACKLFDPIPNPMLTYTPTPKFLSRRVHFCGECLLFINGYCFNAKNAPENHNEPRPKVNPYARACEYAVGEEAQ